MATAQPSPAALAAALQSGVNPTTAQNAIVRSQYLAEALRQLQAQGGQHIVSPAQLGMNLLAVALVNRGKRKADQQVADIQRRVAASVFPNDPRAQLLYLTAPEDMAKAAATAYQTQGVRQGETLASAAGGPAYTAPIMIHDQSFFGTQTPTSVVQTGQRGPTIQEQTAQQNAGTQQAAQAEAIRHNQAMEGIDHLKIPIELAMARAALSNAGTSAATLDLHQATAPTFAVPPGFQLDGGH